MTIFPYIISVCLVLIGTYALLAKDNLIKKIMGLVIFTNGIHLLLISLGYRDRGIPAIMTKGFDLLHFSQLAVDPLPQAMIVTSIVINLSVVAMALALTIQAHRKFASLNVKKLKSLKE